MQAAELSYVKLAGPNQYKVTYRVYRDCGGVDFNGIVADLEYRTTGCTGGPWPRVRMVLVPGTRRTGSDYCAAVGSPCGFNQPTNYETGEFTATLTLPPGQWTMSVSVNARPELGNVENASSVELYTEATLDNRQGQSNSSPVFSSNGQVVKFVGWKLPTTFSQLALDPDGDSLVYELVAPLVGCGTDTLTYKRLPNDGNFQLSATPPCVVVTTVARYSPRFPLASFNLSGTCPILTGQPYFDFNPANGSISMLPVLFNPAVNSAENKNVVAVEVSEYRYLTNAIGQRYLALVGSVRRDILFTVVDCGNNVNPVVGLLTVNGSSVPQSVTTPIAATAGQLITVRVPAADANGTQLLTMTSNVEQALPNSEFTPAPPSVNPTGQITWIPPVTLPSGLYYCTVTTTDDACPIKGVQTQTLTFRVTNTLLSTRPARHATALVAVPTPFQGQVSFQLAKAGVQPVLVFDQLGRQIATLQSLPSGQVQWRPAATVPAGLYLARTPDGSQMARLLRTGTE
ncbi:hypothetical protein GCM10022406_15380 [Hymenobacter algoricola]|uniref:T9SS type A sorting domain-containing protein n=2 Tax=Hymenobacter algoricola TaxID=486267 RepID=A0ABP7MVQ4_9BACT